MRAAPACFHLARISALCPKGICWDLSVVILPQRWISHLPITSISCVNRAEDWAAESQTPSIAFLVFWTGCGCRLQICNFCLQIPPLARSCTGKPRELGHIVLNYMGLRPSLSPVEGAGGGKLCLGEFWAFCIELENQIRWIEYHYFLISGKCHSLSWLRSLLLPQLHLSLLVSSCRQGCVAA